MYRLESAESPEHCINLDHAGNRRRWYVEAPSQLFLALCAALASAVCAAESVSVINDYSSYRGDLWSESHCPPMEPLSAKHFPDTAWDAITARQTSHYDDSNKQTAGRLRFSLAYLAPKHCSGTRISDTSVKKRATPPAETYYQALHASLLSADALLRWNDARMQGKRNDYEPDEQFDNGSSALNRILKMGLKSWWQGGNDNQIQQISRRAKSATSGSASINREIDVDYSFKFSGDNVQLKMEHAF